MTQTEVSFHLREVEFMGGPRYIVYTNVGEDFHSLLSISNLLLLKNGTPPENFCTEGDDGKWVVSKDSLTNVIKKELAKQINLMITDQGIPAEDAIKCMKSVKDLISTITKFVDFQPSIERTTTFEGLKSTSTSTSQLLKYLGVDVYHVLLADPKDCETYNLVKGKSISYLNDLSPKFLLVKRFLNSKNSLTSYGHSCLLSDVPEQCLSLLFMHMQVDVMYKHKGVLHLLVEYSTTYTDVMWLSFNTDGSGELLTSSFSPPIFASHEIIALSLLEEEEKAKSKGAEEEENAKGAEGHNGKKGVKIVKTVVYSVQTFKQFTAANVLFTVFKFGSLSFHSTSYRGRRVGEGYLNFILRMHKMGYSWNGRFTGDNMLVSIGGGSVEFLINLPATERYNKDFGVADCEKYLTIIRPYYKSHKDAKLPNYLDRLQEDYMKMPDYDPMNPKPFDNFQKWVGRHMCWRAPLVRSAFIGNVFKILANERRYQGSNSVDLSKKALGIPWFKNNTFCPPLFKLYHRNDAYSSQTCWCLLNMARNAIEHLYEYTEVDDVHITDPIIVDLILEHDLLGAVSDVLHMVMDANDFGGVFASVWRHYEASEAFDDPDDLKDLWVNMLPGGGAAPFYDANEEKVSVEGWAAPSEAVEEEGGVAPADEAKKYEKAEQKDIGLS